MANTGQYTKHLEVYVTKQMHQFLKLMAERQDTSINDVIRQAIREYLDVQEDVIGSRSRLGFTVQRRLDEMRSRILQQTAHQGKLQLAATIVLLSEQGLSGQEVVRRITDLASRPELNRIVETKE
jgi:hypothetical protein